jgi:AcrR family transcriptional regulator
MDVTRAYRGVPADERREQRRATLIETALDCLHTDGLAGVSVRSVCARARLTPRYFYESFADLDQLLLATVRSVSDEVTVQAVAALDAQPDDLAMQTRAAIDAGYGVLATDPRKATAYLVAASGHGPLRDLKHDLITQLADIAVERLAALHALDRANRQQARAVALFVMGGASEVVEAAVAGRLRMTREQLVEQLTLMWLGALAGVGVTTEGE